MNIRRICVFCGSNLGTNPAYQKAASALARILVARQIEIVYGAGNVGLMGALADSVLAARGTVIGVIPESLLAREVAHQGLTKLRIVQSMHERKALMSDLSDGFIALPGGFGTLEEFCEVLTWSQLGFQAKPCGLLNIAGYYDPLLELFDCFVSEGFLPAHNRKLVLADCEPERLLEQMARFQPPAGDKWIRNNER